MRVLHGVWAREALCLWAEDPDLAAVPIGRPPSPGPHPFACQAAELADVLAALPGPAGEAARKAVGGELTLQLPSAATGPLASPELNRPEPPRLGRVRLAGWRVPVLAFTPAAALDLLHADLGELVVPGASLPYLAALARFADGLATRGRVLPVLVAEDGPPPQAARQATYAARWRPVLGGADVQRARDLAAAMPASCRAAGGEPPGAVAAAALGGLADAAARTRLPGSLLPARRGRTPAHIPLAERYVVALTSTDARLDVVTQRDETEAAALAAELDAWLDRARIPAGPVRTCFRLAEPQVPEEDPWRVEFALQSTEDPSLMVSAADAWAGQGIAAGADPVDELLAGLGAASRLFGELEEALHEPAPTMLELDTAGAFRFLKETGPLLPGPGSGCCCPTGCARPGSGSS